jgi:hypothetical protein
MKLLLEASRSADRALRQAALELPLHVHTVGRSSSPSKWSILSPPI